MRIFGVCFLLAVLAATLGAQSARPQSFARFTPGTLAQSIAITPKGGWTYIVGSTTDVNYPVTSEAFDRTCGTDGTCNVFQGRFGPERQADVVLTVFDASGQMRYSTFLGGSGRDDNPRVALARDGTLWLAGNKTSDAFEHGPAGCRGSLWIARFDYQIRRIEQFLCIDGPALADMELDADGTLWVLGSTGIQTETRDAFQPNNAGQVDMFLARISPSESRPVLATHVGGNRVDTAADLAITPNGDIAIVGSTISTNFPLVRPLKSEPPGLVVHGDAVILVLDRSGRFLEFSTYWGGRFDDRASGLALDAAGNLFVTGTTTSPDMPVTAGAVDQQCDADGRCGSLDAFVVKINPVGELVASTFFGGSVVDVGSDVAIRPNGQVLVLGETQSPDYPLVGGHFFQRWRPAVNSAHTWLATFDNQLQRLTRSEFVGGEDFLPHAARMTERNGVAYVAGQVGQGTGAPSFGTYLAALPLP